MQKFLLAAAAVVTLAAPAVSMAQPYYGAAWREAPRVETSWRYEARREEAMRELRFERMREWRAAHWRAEHRYSYGGYRDREASYGYRPY